MDDSLYFDEHHLATREMVRHFAREEVAPIAAKLDIVAMTAAAVFIYQHKFMLAAVQ